MNKSSYLVKGSNRVIAIEIGFYNLLITNQAIKQNEIAATDIYSVIWESVSGVG